MDIEFDTVVKVLFQGTFVLILTVFFLTWLGKRLTSYLALWQKQGNEDHKTEDPTVVEEYKLKHSHHVETLQKHTDERSQEYNERILVPREDAKKKRKEEEFRRFLGPAWKGEGHCLGGEEQADDVSQSTLPESRRAADSRKVLENINEDVAASVQAAAAAKNKPKRVIQLPEEPPLDSPDVVSVKLRTPIGTMCGRRFHKNDSVQCLRDYITTEGFSDRVYTVSTSYPRQILDDANKTFAELGFGSKVALNIEQKD